MNNNFEANSRLDYKLKILTEKVKSFESGEKYIVMASEFNKKLRAKDRENDRLKQELEKAHRQIITNRKHWEEVAEDLEKEHSKESKEKDRKLSKMEKRALKAERALAVTKDKLHDKTKELYQALTELEEEKGKNLKLKAQIKRDYENSSLPSSMTINHKKITNNREKTNKKPGGQPGHKGHGRRKLSPTNNIVIDPPDEYRNNPDYKETGKIITKQKIELHINVSVTEYRTLEFRNRKTGQRVHAKFPAGVVNDVNYGGSVKAFTFLLNNHCNVSIDKVRGFLSELTEGKLQISKGMVNGLCKEFSKRTETEQKKSFSDLLLSPVMNTDFTNGKLNGKNVQVAICATPNISLYFAREHKGHKGIKGTPVEDYQGILVHDHDKTFYNYGDDHQECLVHVLRYLKNSMENEPSLGWNKKMRILIQQMIHYRKNLNPGELLEEKQVIGFEEAYVKILEMAKDEYEYEPPSKYYKEGFNLYKRLEKFKDNHLLFLHDVRVPTNNNLSERLARAFKRKQRQVMAFRSFDSMSYLCNSMSMISLLTSQDKNLYNSVSNFFEQKPAFR
jgi:hypothetical protein